MRSRIVILMALSVLLGLGTPVLAQDTARGMELLDVSVDRWPKVTARVIAPVGSRGRAAELVGDEITVIEDARPQSSVMVTRADVGRMPISLVLAIDTGNEALRSDRLRTFRETTKTFLSRLGPRDRVALLTFGDRVQLREPFTADRWALAEHIDTLAPTGGAQLADGFLRAAVEAASTPAGSRAVVLATPGRSDDSDALLNEGINVAARAGVPVYSVALSDDPFLEPLLRISGRTRGNVLQARTAVEMADAYSFIRDQVTSQYEITWTTKLSADPGREVHVELKLNDDTQAFRGVRFAYQQPPFANLAAAASGPALIEPIADQAPQILPATAPPNNIQLLIAGMTAGGATVALYFALLRKTVNQRLRDRLGLHIESAEPRLKLNQVAVSRVAGVASAALMRFLSKSQLDRTRQKLLQAGYAQEAHLRNFLAARMILAVILAAYGFVGLQMTSLRDVSLLLSVAMGGFGFLLPSVWLGQKIQRRAREIGRALPDALDMLSVGMTAGLSFDATVLEVSDKWQNSLTNELELTIREMRLGAARRDALVNLSNRTQIDDIRILVTALVQADELGTSLAETLNTQADQLRLVRKHRAEEQAHKAAVKMLIPLVLLIFPALFVVILGPAVPRLIQSLGSQ